MIKLCVELSCCYVNSQGGQLGGDARGCDAVDLAANLLLRREQWVHTPA
jgi:hypothetical protein